MSPNCTKRLGNYLFASITSWFPSSSPLHAIYHNIPAISSATDRQMTGRNDDDLWSAGIYLTSCNTSPKSHSATPATSRQSAASTKMRSELPLKAAHQNCLMTDRRPLLQPSRHCQGWQELFWHNCAPVTAESLVSTLKSTRQRATIATTVVSRLLSPTTFSTVLRSRPHWQQNRYGLRRPKQRNTSTWRLMRRANNNNNSDIFLTVFMLGSLYKHTESSNSLSFWANCRQGFLRY